MGAVPYSLLVLRTLCRGELGIAWEKAWNWIKVWQGRKQAKETLWVPVVHLGTLVLALKMFLQFSDQLLESGWLLAFCCEFGVIFNFLFCVVFICLPVHCPEGTVCHLFSLLQLCLLYLELLCQLLISCCLKLKLFNLIFKLPHNLLFTYDSDLVTSSSSTAFLWTVVPPFLA